VVCVSDKYNGVQPMSKAAANTSIVLGHLLTKETWIMMGSSMIRATSPKFVIALTDHAPSSSQHVNPLRNWRRVG
jgi:hypothetical protein